jgi:transcriptional regulator with XRE-family HTH domain
MLLQICQDVVTCTTMRKPEKDYAEILVTAMRHRGVSQQELADALGKDGSTISRKLQPGGKWWVDQYAKALQYLQVNPTEAFGPGRAVGTVKPDLDRNLGNGGAMAEVYSMVQGLQAFRTDPEGTLKKLRMMVELEKKSPQAFNKLMHDIEYFYNEVASKKDAAAPKKNNSAS